MAEQQKEEAKQRAEAAAKEEAKKEDAASKKEDIKKKRPAINKQPAYIEFKENLGKQIEDSILMARKDMSSKRNIVKELTEKINKSKKRIDLLKSSLDKKEDERKLEHKARKQEMDFDDEAGQMDEIIDEEELSMLREMKDLKRDYRENF